MGKLFWAVTMYVQLNGKVIRIAVSIYSLHGFQSADNFQKFSLIMFIHKEKDSNDYNNYAYRNLKS
jgi:hypothetical protein